jgi:hypothetical protein
MNNGGPTSKRNEDNKHDQMKLVLDKGRNKEMSFGEAADTFSVFLAID